MRNKIKEIKLKQWVLPSLLAIAMAGVVHFRGLFPSNVIEFMFLLLVALSALLTGLRLKRPYTAIIMIFFMVMSAIVSVILSQDTLASLRYALIYIYGMILFIIMNAINARIAIQMLKAYTVISAILAMIVIVAVLLFFTGNSVLDGLLYVRLGNARASGLLENPNYFAVSMLFSFFTSFYLWKLDGGSRIFVLIFAIASLLTFSRGAILAITAFVLLFYYYNPRRLPAVLKYSSLTLVSLVVAFIMLPEAIRSGLILAIEHRLHDRGGGVSDRLIALNASVDDLTKSSLLYGAGRANYSLGYSHNTYLTILSDYGFLGLITFVGFIVSLFLRVKSSAMGICALFSIVLYCFTNDLHLTKELWLTFFVIYFFGNSLRVTRQNEKEARSQKSESLRH